METFELFEGITFLHGSEGMPGLINFKIFDKYI
jgi:hypothetical protein